MDDLNPALVNLVLNNPKAKKKGNQIEIERSLADNQCFANTRYIKKFL